jgi:NADH-quinone oxidoreductase subunit E
VKGLKTALKEELNLDLCLDILKKYDNPSDNMISLLQDIQETYGYLPQDALLKVSYASGIPAARLTGVASFYAQFKLTAPGKHQIMVCLGTACHVNNGTRIAEVVAEATGTEEKQRSSDGLFSWEAVACLGCCSLSPVMMIDGQVYGKLDAAKTRKIIADIRNNEVGGDI